MNITERILASPQDVEIIGKTSLALTDPVTGRVVERMDGKNLAFKDAVLASVVQNVGSPLTVNPFYSAGAWGVLASSATVLGLYDDGTAVSNDFTYLRGKLVGYGQPSQGSSGVYRGGANTALQVLGALSTNKITYKYVYEFGPSQANGTIRSLGLTRQYNDLIALSTHIVPQRVTNDPGHQSVICGSGYHSISISSAGIIKVQPTSDLNNTITIDKTAVVGSNAGEAKHIGYEPSTGNWFISVHSSTAANRKVHRFSDHTFSELLATYQYSNYSSAFSSGCFYVYGGIGYVTTPSSPPTLLKADFVNNVAPVVQTLPSKPPAEATLLSNSLTTTSSNTIGHATAGIIVQARSQHSPFDSYAIDPISNTFVAMFSGRMTSLTTRSGLIFLPGASSKIVTRVESVGSTPEWFALHNSAMTAQVLETPFVKTSANGMIATYELEVYL